MTPEDTKLDATLLERSYNDEWWRSDTGETLVESVNKLVNTFNLKEEDAIDIVMEVFSAARGEYGD